MTTHDEIARIRENDETTHEIMVEAASRMRFYDQEARALERDLASMADNDPKREAKLFLLHHARIGSKDERSLVEAGRDLLATTPVLVAALEE